ncbi:MAG: hypothetical protein U0176_18280 [Bacteroidia bacterium]
MTQVEIAIKMVLDRWNGSVANLNKHLGTLTDAQLETEVARGKTAEHIFWDI